MTKTKGDLLILKGIYSISSFEGIDYFGENFDWFKSSICEGLLTL